MNGERLPLGVVFAVLFALGVVLGIWGVFLVPLRLPGGVEGFSDVFALTTNAAVGIGAAWALRSPPAAAMSGIGWLLSALVGLTFVRPGNEVIIPGKLPYDPGIAVVGELFLVAGAAGAILAVVMAGRFTPRPAAPTLGG